MIPEVDAALRTLIERHLPAGGQVRFGPPQSASEPAPAVVNLFLFGLRDDQRGRVSGWDDVRDAQGMVLGRQPPARRYELSYLVTAWADDVANEHALLDAALCAVGAADALPADCLPPGLGGEGLPVLVRLAEPGPEGLWPALGMPRATFVIAVSAPLLPALDTDLAAPAKDMRLDLSRSVPAAPTTLTPAGGRRWARTQIHEEP